MTRHRIAIQFAGLSCLAGLIVGCNHTADSVSGTTEAPSCGAGIGRDVTTRVESRRVLVHLPACYDRATSKRYPVVYLIHGAGADERQWVDIGMTTEADRLVRIGRTAPAILVMPDEGEATTADEADDLVSRVVPWADATYRTVAQPTERAVGGISRGGGAALAAAGRRPDLFGVVGGHSPTIPADPAKVASTLRPLDGSIWLDVGRRDSLHDGVVELAAALRSVGVQSEVHVWPGQHDRAYWRRHVPEYLTFYASRWT